MNRYETYCGGRILKVIEQVEVTTLGDVANGKQAYVDGSHYWKIDEQRVAADVAYGMLQAAGEAERRPPAEPLILCGSPGRQDWSS